MKADSVDVLLELILLAVFAAAGLLLFASVGGKLAGVHIAGRILHWPSGEATTIGWLLRTKAPDKAIITNESFTALLLMALGSTMLTIPMVAPRLANRMGPLPKGRS